MNIAVFSSHNGSDLQAVIDACANGVINAKVCVVISNNPDSKALERARVSGIDGYAVNNKSCGSEEALNNEILRILSLYKTDIIFLAGYLKKIGDGVLKKYHNRIFNIHPALLPKYGGKGMYGMNVHKAVIDAGEKVSGITVHRVNGGYDEGEIIAKTEIDITGIETCEALAEEIIKHEHIFIVEVINEIISGRVTLG